MYKNYIKRLIDLSIAFVGVLVFSPAIIIISLLIVLESKGGVFFLQKRIGREMKPFNIIKFRTMVKNAEKQGQGVFTSKNDSRVTKVGALLRKFSLDEIPQLFNVFIGNMSVIGPRPPVIYHPYKLDAYPEEFKPRFNIKPGITGLAQISGRTNIQWEKRFEYDLVYEKNISFTEDLKIFFKTVIKVFKSEEVIPSEEHIKKHHKLK